MIAICPDATPATTILDRPQGRIESVSDGAAHATRVLLNTPNLGHAWINAAAGIVQFAFVPAAAGYGAVSSARARLPQEKLSESIDELREAMQAFADQQCFRGLLLESATNIVGDKTILVPDDAGAALSGKPADATLQVRIEQLRLECVDKRDGFVLEINARARLSRTSDGGQIFDHPYRYRSGRDLFVDWARYGGFESVARTGYREIADRIARELANGSSEVSLLLGAGFSGGAGQLVPVTRAPVSDAREEQVAFVSFGRPGIQSALIPAGFVKINEAVSEPQIRLVAFGSQTPSFEIRASDRNGLLLQLPQTRAEAMVEAQSETEYLLGGLDNDRNFVVQTSAALAAVPLGIWEQSKAMWNGLSRKRLSVAAQTLGTVAKRARPHQVLALGVAQNLALRHGSGVAAAPAQSSAALSRCAFPVAGTPLSSDALVKIRVLGAGLSGPEGTNPRLAFQVQVEASVVRVSDGAVLFSIPVHYRSHPKRFCAWAAHDARAFREELTLCYQEMSQVIARELAAHGLNPSRLPSPVLANN